MSKPQPQKPQQNETPPPQATPPEAAQVGAAQPEVKPGPTMEEARRYIADLEELISKYRLGEPPPKSLLFRIQQAQPLFR